MPQKLWHFRHCDLFDPMAPKELAQVEARCRVKSFAGSLPMELPLDRQDTFFLLVSGRIKARRIMGDGKPSKVAFLKPGDLFGAALTIESATYEEDIEAVGMSTVVLIPSCVTRELVQGRPDLAQYVSGGDADPADDPETTGAIESGWSVCPPGTVRQASHAVRDSRRRAVVHYATTAFAVLLLLATGALLATQIAARTNPGTVKAPLRVLTCSEVQKGLDHYGRDLLDRSFEEQISAHLETCRHCSQRYREARTPVHRR
jgi:CRP-like cAMP-binding protein